jgi:transcriptional regulator with XRE-family HTH domain
VPESVGRLLRGWRLRRKLSQLELANLAEVSARHISFVETGRTNPSSAMVVRLAERLGVPLRERNRLLVAAGHAPVYRERAADDPDFGRVRAALDRILRAHEPYPAVAVDRRWTVLSANAAFGLLVEDVAPELLREPVNLMRLGFHPLGFAPRVRNLDQVRSYLLPRLERQAANSGDRALHALCEELRSYGGGNEGPSAPDPADIALPIRIDHHGAELCFLTTVTTFGAPFDVALDEVAVETYLPADEATAAHCRRVAAGRQT